MSLPDEIKYKIILYKHPNKSMDYADIFYNKKYKTIEEKRCKIHHAELLYRTLYSWCKSLFDDIMTSNSNDSIQLRQFLNSYYGSYDEYYINDIVGSIFDIKELSDCIVRDKLYIKQIRNKLMMKDYIRKYNKLNRNVYSLTLENPLHYAKNKLFSSLNLDYHDKKTTQLYYSMRSLNKSIKKYYHFRSFNYTTTMNMYF